MRRHAHARERGCATARPLCQNRPRFREFPVILREKRPIEVADNKIQKSIAIEVPPSLLAAGTWQDL